MAKNKEASSSTIGYSILDNQQFLCQNAITGEVLSNRWTLRQLCRILCPPLSEPTSTPSEEPGSQTASSSMKVVSPNSQLLAIEADGSYSSEGWKPARTLDVLKEAVAVWYYQNMTLSSSAPVEGPVSCRYMASLVNQSKLSLKGGKTRVYSETTGQWDSISAFPNLLCALDAFRHDSAPIPSSTSVQTEERPFPGDTPIVSNLETSKKASKDTILDELESFLSSTAHSLTTEEGGDDVEEGTDETQNDETTMLGQPQDDKVSFNTKTQKHESLSNKALVQNRENLKKRKRPKFSAKHSKCWIYITGLPVDCTMEELQRVFSKAGIIDLDPENQLPKIKVYTHKDGTAKGQAKGDASICYARPESVQLAITLLDETPLRPSVIMDNTKDTNSSLLMKVQPAKFEQHGTSFDASKGTKRVSNVKRQVAKLAAIQARDWDEGEVNGRISGGRKGLRIIVIKNLFDPTVESMNDTKMETLHNELHAECSKFGVVEKITMFEKNPDGVVIVKFTTPGSASEAVRSLNGRDWKTKTETVASNGNRRLRVGYWDGITDYTMHMSSQKEIELEMQKRQEDFGEWLEEQELPEELRLKTANES